MLRGKKRLFLYMLLIVTILLCSLEPFQAAEIPNLKTLTNIEIEEESIKYLNEPIKRNETVMIRFNVSYTVFASSPISNLYNSAIQGIIKYLLFKKMIVVTPVPIQLTISESLPWATTQFLIETIYLDPLLNDTSYTEAILIISPEENNPTIPTSITITAKSQPYPGYKLQPSSNSLTLWFQSSYNNQLSVDVKDPIQIQQPLKISKYEILVTNNGNKETLVRASTQNIPSDWAPLLSTTEAVLQPKQSYPFVLSVTGPRDLGWHNELENLTVELSSQHYPPTSQHDEYKENYVVSISLNNHGFSTPWHSTGASLFGILLAFFFILRRQREQ